MTRTTSMIVCGLALGFGASCLQYREALDPTHCNSNGGDVFCASEHPDGSRPFCRLGTLACDDAGEVDDKDFDGCVAERPEDACYSACGQGMSVLDDPDCEGQASTMSSSSGSGSDTGVTETTADETDGSTTGGPECEQNADCTDPTAPLCDPAGACVGCDAMPDPNGACAELDPSAPVCDAGVCVECTPDQALACGGQTPVCGEDNACAACTEHDECPESACHLDGPDVGACFDVAEVQMIADAGELTAALGGLGAMDRAVLVLAAGTYSTSVDIGVAREVAILGQGAASISGDGGLNSVELVGSSITYFDDVTIAGNSNGNGVSCSGTSVWLDDTQVRNNSQLGLDVSGGCAAHLRRTVVRGNAGGGVEAAGAATVLSMANSVVGDNVGPAAGPGIRVTSAAIDITYSAAVSNGTFAAPNNIECLSGATGSVRNSILSGPSGSSIITCGALTWESNAVDTSGLGMTNVDVGTYDAAWFSDTGTGDYHLTTAGEGVFMDIATWQAGDPTTDIDGDPIPSDMPSFPGYDQP